MSDAYQIPDHILAEAKKVYENRSGKTTDNQTVVFMQGLDPDRADEINAKLAEEGESVTIVPVKTERGQDGPGIHISHTIESDSYERGGGKHLSTREANGADVFSKTVGYQYLSDTAASRIQLAYNVVKEDHERQTTLLREKPLHIVKHGSTPPDSTAKSQSAELKATGVAPSQTKQDAELKRTAQAMNKLVAENPLDFGAREAREAKTALQGGHLSAIDRAGYALRGFQKLVMDLPENMQNAMEQAMGSNIVQQGMQFANDVVTRAGEAANINVPNVGQAQTTAIGGLGA